MFRKYLCNEQYQITMQEVFDYYGVTEYKGSYQISTSNKEEQKNLSEKEMKRYNYLKRKLNNET